MTRRTRNILLAVAAVTIGGRVLQRFLVPYWPPAVSSLEEIAALPTGQRDVRAIAVDDARLVAIVNHLPMLDYLLVNSSQITDVGVVSLARLNHLRQVVIVDASALSDDAITTLASLPALRELIIERCPRITDSGLDALITKGGFTSLQLNGCSKLTPEAKQRARAAMPTCRMFFEDRNIMSMPNPPSQPTREKDARG